VPWPLVLFAAGGVAGSLALSLVLGLWACPLCFYQRAFACMAFASLALSLRARSSESALLGLRIAGTAAIAGGGVAVGQIAEALTAGWECPPGLGGLGTAPQQSLAFFLVLTAWIAWLVVRSARWAWILPAVLGGVLIAASLLANPPPGSSRHPEDASKTCHPAERRR
jgi:disulfide bond formation protein DsbB